MTCRPEFESEQQLEDYINRTTEGEVYVALGDLLKMSKRFEKIHQATAHRLDKLFDFGCDLYEKRFGEIWVPF